MLIDWFTVIAQTLNFLILVWLLKRFLYKPILDAIDAREQRIAQELADADAKKIEARQERDEFERKNNDFDEKRASLMREMKEEINIKRRELLEAAQRAADVLSTKRHEALQREQRTFAEELSRRAQEQVFSITRKTLGDLADSSLEESMTKVFTRRLRELNGQAKQELGQLLTALSEPARVRSTFELPAAQQAEIQRAMNETFAADIPLLFDTAPDTIGGIEVTCSGRKLAWSIDEYLKGLERTLAELIEPHTVSDQQIKVRSETTA